jgi:branched-chain amino acid transport system permease protein
MSGNILSFLAGTVALAAIYAIYTLGFNLQFGYTDLANMGYVAFFAIGAYVSVILTYSPPGPMDAYRFGFNLPIWVGVIAAAPAAALFAFLTGLPTLKIIKADYFIAVTFAFAEIVRMVMQNEIWLTNGNFGFYGLSRPFKQFFSSYVYEFFFASLMVGSLIIAYLIMRRICNSPFGRMLKGIRENDMACQSLGKDIFRAKLKSYMIGAAFAGVAGSLYALYATVIVPEMFVPSVTFVAWWAVMMGGKGNNKGAILGAFIFVFVDQLTIFTQASAAYATRLSSLRGFIMGAMLILILRFLPRGVLKEKKVVYDSKI